jgi:hypothetical protein
MREEFRDIKKRGGMKKERNGKEKKNVQRLITKDKKGYVCYSCNLVIRNSNPGRICAKPLVTYYQVVILRM